MRRQVRISAVSMPQMLVVKQIQQLRSDSVDTSSSSDSEEELLTSDSAVVDEVFSGLSGSDDDKESDFGSGLRDPNVVGFVPTYLLGNTHLTIMPNRCAVLLPAPYLLA